MKTYSTIAQVIIPIFALMYLGIQAYIMARQAFIMNKQNAISAKQNAISVQQTDMTELAILVNAFTTNLFLYDSYKQQLTSDKTFISAGEQREIRARNEKIGARIKVVEGRIKKRSLTLEDTVE